MILVMLNTSLVIAAFVLALRFGGRVERYGAAIVAMMFVLGRVGTALLDRQFLTVDMVSTAQDVLALAGFAYLGIYTKKVWPLWAAAFQLLSVGAHFIRALEIAVRPVVYAWMKSGPTWAVLLLLIIGTLGHHRRMSSSGNARSWPS